MILIELDPITRRLEEIHACIAKSIGPELAWAAVKGFLEGYPRSREQAMRKETRLIL